MEEFDLKDIAELVDYTTKTLDRRDYGTRPDDLEWICEQWWRRKKLPELIQAVGAIKTGSIRAAVSKGDLDPDDLRSVFRYMLHEVAPDKVYEDIAHKMINAARGAARHATLEVFMALDKEIET